MPADGVVADWYKDAIFYELHIKAYQDADGDGIGDLNGLIQRLDYVQGLGATAIWLLPFYPSPQRDDGYDISDYETVNPSYGTIDDFKRFVDEAHYRGLRVITELVINHTSDQHPWFQRARKAPAGSPERDFYVWSDTEDRYAGTRIIFLDTEQSNWTWDSEAGAFFWHRFYSHQPDLNFDNPAVLEAVLKVMHFWLDLGVDGLRLDAIPYLVEREGTNNENLPETHEILKKIRTELDAHYPDRMLLAEANQWPEDTAPYFGDGDECHMAFHFPLMPRMFIALAQEDRHPITDILRQTPAIPPSCQWAIFLRNHDELTLEMVTDEERDYLWTFYASDRRSRLNLGIRRRLAPLLDNDRRKIELMNGLLFAMPGTPVIYYGDEIGMGDNYFLGDRDGVRTPMQWTADRNAGFSRAIPQQLYLPTIQDPVYGFEAVNVEAQAATPSSLLNWMKRMIRIRKRQKAFGRGSFGFVDTGNRKILAFLRSYDDEVLFCVFNVSRSAQAAEFDLSNYKGRVPVELEGGTAFPPIGDLPYLLTLPPYGFFWFQLAGDSAMPDWHKPVAEILPEFVTLTCRSEDIPGILNPESLHQLALEVLPDFLPLQRWYGAKGEDIEQATLLLGPPVGHDNMLAIAKVTTRQSGELTYLLPLSCIWGEEHLQFGAPTLSVTLARVRRFNQLGALLDASTKSNFARAMVSAMARGVDINSGCFTFQATGSKALTLLARGDDVRPLGVDQTNISIVFGEDAVLKIYRRLNTGQQPDIEIARYLTEHTDFTNSPVLLGEATMRALGEEPATVAALFAFVSNQGDGWRVVVDSLVREIEDRSLGETVGVHQDEDEDDLLYSFDLSVVLGQRTGELHRALAAPSDDPAFGIEPITADDLATWVGYTRARADEAFGRLESLDVRTDDIEALLERRGELEGLIGAFAAVEPTGAKSRIHGDYHLGQVLVAHSDVFIIDFEGEPRRSLAERREKSSPLRDVAGMLRSFDYAAFAAIDRIGAKGIGQEVPATLAMAWRNRTARRFLAAYYRAMRGVATLPKDDHLLRLFILQKALYEVSYEATNRPSWLTIPVRGILGILDGEV